MYWTPVCIFGFAHVLRYGVKYWPSTGREKTQDQRVTEASVKVQYGYATSSRFRSRGF